MLGEPAVLMTPQTFVLAFRPKSGGGRSTPRHRGTVPACLRPQLMEEGKGGGWEEKRQPAGERRGKEESGNLPPSVEAS